MLCFWIACYFTERELTAALSVTQFVKIDAEKAPFLVERLGIIMLPTIVCIKDGKTEHSVIGFDEMGGGDEFPTEMLAFVLAQHKVLKYDGPAPDDEGGEGMVRHGVNSIDMRRNASIREGGNSGAVGDEEEDDFEGLDEM